MLEVYLFLAVFPVLILAMSVLYPARLTRTFRAALAKVPAERLAELYPEVDVRDAHARFFTHYHTANAVIAVLGIVLLGWFFNYMQRPAWDEGRVRGMLTAYALLQNLPIILIAWFMNRFNKLHRVSPPAVKRKATLQRRGPFDFVSPFVVLLAVLSYFLFVAFNFYVAQRPFPGYAGPFVNIGIVTLMYVLGAFAMFMMLYGRKKDPLQTHADRMRVISVVMNCYAWSCILVPIFLTVTFARKLLDLETWGPFAVTVFFLALGIVSLRTVIGSSRQTGADELGSSPVHQ